MLDPDDRAVLVEALRPPPGTRLDRAVATTFTLDLEALITIPLAFASNRLQDPEDSISVMEAIRECSDRIDIFAQAGQLRTPLTRSALFAFLEPMVHLVAAPGRLFHPKIWLVSYVEESGGVIVRLLVLTRNLTSDRSWDLCLTLEGSRGTRPHAGNKPVVDLVRWCLRHGTGPSMDADRRSRVDSLLEDVRRTTWTLPEKATQLSFHTLGAGGPGGVDLAGRRHLVLSPFVTEGGLARAASSPQPVVISRQEELDKLPLAVTDRLQAYVLDEAAALKDDESGETAQGVLSGLHAKAYVAESGAQAVLTVGSANATDAGWGANVEFVVQLRGARKDFGIDTVTGAGGMAEMLVPYARQPALEADEDAVALQASLTAMASLDFFATVSGERDQWVLGVTATEAVRLPPGVTATLGLLTRRGDAQPLHDGQVPRVTFVDLRTTEVTPFVVLTIRIGDLVGSTMVRATLENDPADRLDTVLADQVDSPEKFLRWLYLLLGQSSLLLELGHDAARAAGSGLWERLSKRGLFETLVNGLADSPAQLADVGRFVDRVRSTEQGRAVLPPGFLEVWDLVDGVRNDLPLVGGWTR